ncbi:hypothetical protein ABKW28_14640 [Nocardioides sp. 31GB23]|uniref:hypothetical protein n=1 Tax=Nocardioides sp. 31GB23 TaxID=3156065 RepID=UPI0032AF56B0
MRLVQAGMTATLMLFAVGCGEDAEPAVKATDASTPASITATSLPCEESEQTYAAWDVPGPGRPTPEAAVAPCAGSLTLVAHQTAKGTTVLGLRADGSLFRVFDVTKSNDGWWPDGYRECSN